MTFNGYERLQFSPPLLGQLKWKDQSSQSCEVVAILVPCKEVQCPVTLSTEKYRKTANGQSWITTSGAHYDDDLVNGAEEVAANPFEWAADADFIGDFVIGICEGRLQCFDLRYGDPVMFVVSKT